MLVIVLIVLTGFFFRAWRLDSAPQGALIDELHFGYLAHSLNMTGADEHGKSWPIIFTGFGDQKLPAYAYVLMPIIGAMGLTVQALRIPSLVAGTISIALMYVLSRQLKLSQISAIMVSLLTAISPWPFFLSRIGFESNLALYFFLAGLVILIAAINRPNLALKLIGAALLAATWYAYIAYRPVTLALLIIALILYKVSVKQSAIIITFFLVLIAPLFTGAAIGANSARFEQIGITNDPGLALKINEQRTFCSMTLPSQICYAVFNKPLLISQTLIARALRVISPQYLAFEGEDEAFLTVKGFGQFPLVIYPFFLLGLIGLLLNQNLPHRERKLIALGLLIAAVPALMAGEPQKVRLSPWLPFALLTIGNGINIAISYIQTQKAHAQHWLYLGLGLFLAGGLLWNTSSYAVSYFGVHTIQHEAEYQSYLPELYKYIQTLPADSLVVIRPFYSDPLMFYAFYTQMDPTKYQQQAVLGELEASGFQHTVELGSIWAKDFSLPAVGCAAALKDMTGYLVTNQQLPEAPLHQIKSSNNVHTYVYIYAAPETKLPCSEYEL